MLDFMRRNASSTVVKITLGLITLTFIFFMGGGGRLGRGAGALATVGDTTIGVPEFEQAWRRNESFYREQYGDKLTPEALKALDLPSVTLNQLVESAVLRGEADRLGLRVPDQALRDQIRAIPAFKRDGQFSPTLYRASLEGRGMNATVFEQQMRRDMLAEQLVDILRRGVHVTEDEAFRDWAKTSEKIALSYVRVPSSKFLSQVTVSQEALTKFFEDHAESYREPEAVRLRFLSYTPAHFAAETQIKEEAIEEYYVLNENEFDRPETVSARHILKKVSPDADEQTKAAAQAAIAKVKARLDAGEDFAKVAKEESEDPGSAANGGDLGAFGRGKMVKPFDDAAFGLSPGEMSGIVETPFGYHIILAYARQDAGKRPLAEVHDEIAKTLRDKAATDRAFELAASDALELREGRSSMAKVAEARGLTPTDTDFLTKTAVVPDIGASPAFMDAAFALTEKGATSDPVRIGDSYYIIQLEERRDSRVPQLSEVRENVEKDFRAQQASDLANKKASELVEALEGGKTLDQVATAEGLEIGTTEPFTRGGGFVPGVGNVRGLKDVAFQTTKDGEVLPRSFAQGSDAFVFVRKSFEEANREDFDADKGQILEAVQQREEQAAVGEFIRTLKEKTQISFNEDLLSRYMQK
jgi:peptidyl-prolyl cis-trans isomerase D